MTQSSNLTSGWILVLLPEPGMAGRRSGYIRGLAEGIEQFYSGHLTPEMPSANTRRPDLPSRLKRKVQSNRVGTHISSSS